MEKQHSWEVHNPTSFLTNLDGLQVDQNTRTAVVRRRGIQRYLVVIVDGSSAMSMRDLMPTRSEFVCRILLSSTDEKVKSCLPPFITAYFENNPISQLHLMLMSDGDVHTISPLCGNPQLHLSRATQCAASIGNVSLKVALNAAINSLKNTPHYGTREVLVILGALATVDQGSIQATLKSLTKHNVVCSIIGLSAEVYICGQICKETRGTYRVSMNQLHFNNLLMEHIQPPPVFDSKADDVNRAGFIEIGFPTLVLKLDEANSEVPLCLCHKKLRPPPYYICPRCKSIQCEIPNNCTICGLTLISSSDLAHSYHYLFPIPNFNQCLDQGNGMNVETSFANYFESEDAPNRPANQKTICFGCQFETETEKSFQCPRCENLFCNLCDNFIHNSVLYDPADTLLLSYSCSVCPGCE